MSFVSCVADKVLFLDKGKNYWIWDNCEEIMKAPKEERTKEFLLVTNEHLFDTVEEIESGNAMFHSDFFLWVGAQEKMNSSSSFFREDRSFLNLIQ